MKRIAMIVGVTLGVALSTSGVRAEWGSCTYSGWQPCWNLLAPRNKCMTPEEKRLQKFWHDYYDAMKHYYGALDHLDWVAYYKNHGYQINGGCCGPNGACRINYAPVFVTPTLQWAVPSGCLNGPPCGPGGPGCCPPGGGY